MRPAGNFNPEWGYLAPAPSFMRTVRLITVATAIGGAAGAGVVLSLADRPLETSVAARTLVRPVDSAAAASLVTVPPQAAVAQARPQAQRDMQSETRIDATKSAAASGRPADAAASESGAMSTPQRPANVAALAEIPATTDDATTKTANDSTPAQNIAPAAPVPTRKKAKSKQHASHYASRGGPYGPLPGEYGDSYGTGGSYRAGSWGGYYSEGRY